MGLDSMFSNVVQYTGYQQVLKNLKKALNVVSSKVLEGIINMKHSCI